MMLWTEGLWLFAYGECFLNPKILNPSLHQASPSSLYIPYLPWAIEMSFSSLPFWSHCLWPDSTCSSVLDNTYTRGSLINQFGKDYLKSTQAILFNGKTFQILEYLTVRCSVQGGTLIYLTMEATSSVSVCVCVRWLSCLIPCDPMDCSPPGSSVLGISQAIILEWVAISFFRGSSWPKDQTHICCIGRWILYHGTTWEALHFSV